MEFNMNNFKLQFGDIFITGPGIRKEKFYIRLLEIVILFISRLWAKDREAKGTHAGIILNENGLTQEATIKGTLSKNNFFEYYKGKYVIIFRYKKITHLIFLKALRELEEEFKGESYPTWKLFFYPMILIARFFNFGRAVCGEVVAYILWKYEVRHKHWSGTFPEMIRDELRDHRDFEIIYEGILE